MTPSLLPQMRKKTTKKSNESWKIRPIFNSPWAVAGAGRGLGTPLPCLRSELAGQNTQCLAKGLRCRIGPSGYLEPKWLRCSKVSLLWQPLARHHFAVYQCCCAPEATAFCAPSNAQHNQRQHANSCHHFRTPATREVSRLPVTQVGGGCWSTAICVTSC